MTDPTWNGEADPVQDVSSLFSHRLGWPVRFKCPKHLTGGALEVLAGEYDPHLTQIAPTWNPYVLDIGANVGAFALWVRHKWPNARISSFEPNPRAFEVLEENRALAGGAWEAHRIGIGGGGAAIAQLYPGRGNLGEASIHPDVGGCRDDEAVSIVLQDAALLPSAQIVKVDTEGCEVEILDRYLSTHTTMPTLVLLEFHRTIDRLVLEELLAWHGLALMRGFVLSPVRGTLMFARTRETALRARVPGDLEELRARVAHVAGLITPAP